MKKQTIMVFCLAMAGSLMAQESVDPAAALAAQADAAAKLAEQADAAAKLLPGVPTEGAKTAEEVVQANLKKLGVGTGYDRTRHAIICIGTAQAKIGDPANDKDFMKDRQSKANEAYLNAKAEIIRSIYTEMSAVDRLSVQLQKGVEPSTKAYDEKRKALDAKRVELAKKVEQLDKSEAAAFAGVTVGDRFNAVLEGFAKKLDDKFNADKISADKRALRDSLKAECAALKAECDALEQEAKAIEPPIPTTSNEGAVKLLSRMPLLGSSVVTQAESWNAVSGEYSISMALIWNPKMQEAAVTAVTDEVGPKMRKGRFTPQEWASRQNFATMVGPRRFTDSEGNNIFVGICSVDLTGPIAHKGAKKKYADAFARRYVGTSIAGDIESYTEAANKLNEYDGDEKRVSVSTLSETISAKCEVVLKGCSQLSVQTVKHPITGRETYVVAYYIDPNLSKDAGDLLKKAYAGAKRQAEAINKLRAEKRVYEESLKRERENRAKAAAAAAKARQELAAAKARQTKLAEERKRELERQRAEAEKQRLAAEARERELMEQRKIRLAEIEKEKAAEAAKAREHAAQLEAIRKANEQKFHMSMEGVWGDTGLDKDALPD